MRLFLSNSAKADFELYKADAPGVAEKIKAILRDILSHPSTGLGGPVELDGPYVDLWQRSFAPGQVIIYSFDDEEVKIVSIGTREGVLKKVHLEAYTGDEERSVMDQMSANRGKDGEPKVGIFW